MKQVSHRASARRQSSPSPFLFMSLPPESKDPAFPQQSIHEAHHEVVRHTIYLFYLDDLDTDIDNHVTVERRTTTMTKGRALQVRDVHSTWTSILGVNCQIRQEVSVLFWKFNTIRLRPGTLGSLNGVAFGNIRNIYLEVITPQRRVQKFAFTLSDFRRGLKTILRLPSLQNFDTVIDVPSILACIPIKGAGLCRKHVHHISSFDLSYKVREELTGNWAGYHTFRLTLTNEAHLQAQRQIIQDFPSLSKAPNNCLASCPDHTLGSCDEITCRLLHAIEEMCQEGHGKPIWRRHYFEEPSPAYSVWTPNTTVWRPSSRKLPLIVDITDLRTEQSVVSSRLRSDSFLFENMYFRKEDTDEEDTDEEDTDEEDTDKEDEPVES